MRYIGVDLHTTQITVCYLERNKYTFETVLLSELERFKSQLRVDDLVAVEATGNSRWFINQCQSLVFKVVVVNTNQFKIISRSCSKTDKNDAKNLAVYLSKEMLPEAKVKSDDMLNLQSLIDTRIGLVEQRTVLKNQIHSIFTKRGIKIKASMLESNKGLIKVKELITESIINFNIKILVDSIETINFNLKQIDNKLHEEGTKLNGFEHLNQISGLGKNTALMLLVSIGNIKDFESSKKLSAYFGLVPSVHNSNDKVCHGGITKRGDAKIRRNLVQCALVAIKYNQIFNNFYTKIKQKKGHGKAIIATARKLLSFIYEVLNKSWYFTDYKNNVKEVREICW